MIMPLRKNNLLHKSSFAAKGCFEWIVSLSQSGIFLGHN